MISQISSQLCYFLLRVVPIAACLVLSLGGEDRAIAQSITKAHDGTGTNVTQNGSEYLINGGTRSGDNLFQSFDQFGLNSGETANFIGSPELNAILGRVTGGETSLINGLLKVSNSNADLYLMNPAGFVFGTGANLDVNGSFAATTATRIGFGENFFNSFGANNYAGSSGAPTSFVFDTETGMILNQGNLAVPNDQSLWLVGSSILNLGTLSGGNISLTAMPSQSQIKISQEGSLLSLALDAAPLDGTNLNPNLELLTPTDLPQYLTGNDEQIDVTNAGQITLKQGANAIPFNAGDVGIANTIQGDNVQLMAAGRVTPTDTSLIQAGTDGVGGLTVARFRENIEDQLGYTFIDQRVDNPKQLLFGGEAGTIATIILRQEAGIAAVTQALLEFAATGQKLDAINIVAEGNQGYFWLGNELVNGATLGQYQTQLQQWRSALGEDADLLLYSCLTALGMDGEAFINQLANLTGADVAASLDATGSADFNGNWNLEYNTGNIAANNPFNAATLATWEGKLATILVTNLNDSGAGSLRNAIENLAANGDLITPTISGDVVLTSGQILWATDNLTLDATGQTFAIDGNNSDRVIKITGENAEIINTTIKNGYLNYGSGAGIYIGDYFSDASLTLNNSTVTNNSINNGNGAGIFVGGNLTSSLTLTNSTVSNNQINRSGDGAGIFVSNGSYGETRFLTVTDSTISNNSADAGDGGGILLSGYNTDPAIISGSTISGNTAGSDGGGIENRGSIDITNTTISENTAGSDGGGIYSSGSIDITNATISSNTAGRNGGGILNYYNMDITNVTISDNSATNRGGGIFNTFGEVVGTLNIQNSIVANSASGGDIINARAVINFNGINLVEDGSQVSPNIINRDPNLTPLGDYGGVTKTHFLLPFSVALDAGDNDLAANPNDQRGGSRIVNGTVDLGAVEFQGTNLALILGDGQQTFISTPFNPLVFEAKEKVFDNILTGLTVKLDESSAITTDPGFAESSFEEVTDSLGRVSFLTTANTVAGTFEFAAETSAGGADLATTSGNLTNLEEIQPPPPPVDPPVVEPPVDPPVVEPPVDPPVVEPPVDPPVVEPPVVEFEDGDCATSCNNPDPREPIFVEAMEIAVEDIKGTLKKIEENAKTKAVLIYPIFRPASPVSTKDVDVKDEEQNGQVAVNGGEVQWEFRSDRLTDFLNATTENFLNPRENLNGSDELELIMITPAEKVVRVKVPGVTRAMVMEQARLFLKGVTDTRLGKSYLSASQSLYDVLVRPLELELEKEEIDNLTYVMDDGLRTLPLAALHDGDRFLVEKYSVGLMPSFSLTNTSNYVEPKSNLLLAMGASEFVDQNQDELPAAPLEVQIIAKDIWQGDSLTEDQFTVENLVEARREKPYGILHLATHGEFRSGRPADSYIQFEDEKISLDQLDRLQLSDPPLELLVLSACRTAIGDRNAELGFAGLALNSGAKSALGSIWYVSDTGTMGLMTRFYHELQNAPTKAEALRQAQLSLLRNEVYLEGNTLMTPDGRIELPGDFNNVSRIELTHPFFWSGFALVGNPW